MKPFDLSQYMARVAAASGAGLMGYSSAQTYAAGTVGAALKGLGTMSGQNANAVNITGGAINGVNPLGVGLTAIVGTSPLQVSGDVSILTSPAGGMGYNFNTYWKDGDFKAHAAGFSGALNFDAGTGNLSLLVSAASVTAGATTAMQTILRAASTDLNIYKNININAGMVKQSANNHFVYTFTATGQPADKRTWELYNGDGSFYIRTVNDAYTTSTSAIRFDRGEDGFAAWQHNATRFYVGGVERVAIRNSGLSILSPGDGYSTLRLNSSHHQYIWQNTPASDNGGGVRLWNENSAFEQIRFNASGNTGIRHSNPGATFHVQGSVAASSYQLDGQNYWNLSGGYHPYYNYDTNDYMIYNRTADELQFIIGGVHQASIGWNTTCVWARDQVTAYNLKAGWACYVGNNTYLHQNGLNEGIVQLGPAGSIKVNTSGGHYFDVNGDWAFHCAPDRNLRTRLSIFPLTHGGGHSGWPGIAWADCYAHSYPGPSDERQKDWRGGLSLEELAAAKAIIAEIGAFRWLFEIQRDGEKAGFHIGVRAQQVWRIMAEHGLIPPLVDGKPSGPNPYSFIRYEEWDEEVVPPSPTADIPGPPAPQTPPTGPVPVPPDNDIPDTEPPEIEPAATAPVWEPYQASNDSTEHVRPAGSIFMVCVQELALFLVAAQQAIADDQARRTNDLETRLAALEAA